MDKIGPYEVLETLGMGSQPLYRAKAPDGRIVELKTTPVEGLTPEMREQLLREGETYRALDHPNLLRVFERGEAGGVLYQATELPEGQDLARMLAGGRTFTWAEKLSIMEQVCDGLQYAHEHKIHCDIKPANIFLENSGRVRLLVFGTLRAAESDLTKTGGSIGTLNYMSPEQIRGERSTAATDVFSAGTVFYELASGQHPFWTKDRSMGQVVSAIVFESPPSLNGLRPDAPEGLEFILNKAMEKDPANRIQNVGDLKQDLALCRVSMKWSATMPRPTPLPQAAPTVDEEKTQVMLRPAPMAPVPAPSTSIPATDHASSDSDSTRQVYAPSPPPPRPAPRPPPSPYPQYPTVPPSAEPERTLRRRSRGLPSVIVRASETLSHAGRSLSNTFRSLFGKPAYPTTPPHTTIDHVHFSLTAPSHLSPGKIHEIYLWAHLESQRETVISRAMQALGLLLPKKLVMKTEGPVEVERGAELTVALRIEGMAVKQDHKTILWTGEIGNASFTVEVPAKGAEGTHAGFASIRVCGSEIARLDFVMEVKQGRAPPKRPVPAALTAHQKAFASYASEDRDEVLKRVQGIRKAKPDMEIFLDVMSLRAGVYWEKELATVIPQSDIFYLFWSRRAKASTWVQKEWRCAYDTKGLDFIDPVPLEPERLAPPPNELRRKHFDDPILAFMGSANRG